MNKLAIILAVGLFSSPAFAANSKLNMCTGKSEGGYYIVGQIMKTTAKNYGIDIVNVSGTGGTWGNIVRTVFNEASPENVANGSSCDLFVGQRDGIMRLQRQNRSKLLSLTAIGPAVTETIHLLCQNDAGVKKVSDLSDKTKLAVGGPDSGSRLVWDNAVNQNPSFKSVPIVSDDPLSAVTTGSAKCGIIVGAAPDPDMVSANDNYGDKLLMADYTDSSLAKVVDPITTAALYREVSVPKQTYANLLRKNYYHGDTYVEDSFIIANKEKVSPQQVEILRKVLNDSRKEIQMTLVPEWAR